MALPTGARLASYEILGALGAGGMGEVYRARDTKLGRDVAIKVLPDLFAADTERLARFQREAQLLAALNHPNIAAIYGLDDAGATRFIVMELVEGQSLDARLKPRAPLDSSDGTRGSSRAPEAPIDVKDLIASTSIEELNAAAEQYFASLTNWDHHLAKPFSGVDEAPWLLTHFTVVLEALRLKPGLTVLEFGAGTGWASRFLTQLGCRVILLDVSATALRIAQELYARVRVIGDQPAPEFLVFDGQRIDLPDASVDRVMCLHAFHHVPNPTEMIAEFGRILRPGGRAAFAEPGPTHSRAAQSQFEMRSYRVVENDVDVHELWRVARGCGFTDLQMMVFHGLPFHVTLDRFEDFLRGGETCAEWLADARVFLRNIRNFVLVKEGTERSDSRSSAGLTCEIDARLSEPAREGSPIAVRVIATNVGEAVWLPRTADIGGVSLGFHVFDESGTLLRTEVLSNPLKEGFHEVVPGEMATLTVALPPLPKGRYVVEIDCVADRVGWFAQLGSRPALFEVDVKSASSG
jgi:SAM-dependent methyltransferase